jgi:cell fate regulator YaaT (PSP1 superfamily)
VKTIGVRFRRASKIYLFEAPEADCVLGDRVIVETERGMALGKVAASPRENSGPFPQPLKKVVRMAEERDVQREEKNHELEIEARRACIGLIAEKNLPMKLLTVDVLFDRSKIIFNFASEGRVDFRELVRDLAKRFHTRIEMRQVGVRDEAKMVGGVGCCGRELCCAIWLSDFAPISVRMAKSQNISLNPGKISGICSRLMCCLAYEHQMYEDLSQGMPKVGKRVRVPKGEGKVLRRNALEGSFVVLVEGEEIEVTLEEYRAFTAPQAEEKGGSPARTDRPAADAAEPAAAEARKTAEEVPEGSSTEAAGEGARGTESAPGEERRGGTPGRTGRRRRRRRKPGQSQAQAQAKERERDG